MSRVPNKLLAILLSLMSFLCAGLGIEKSGSTGSDPGDSQPSELNFSSKEGQILTLNFTFPKKLSATESMNMNLNRNQKKIAEINFKGGQGNKYNGKRITFIWQGETQTATLSISGLIKNDSGVYQCNYVLNSKVEVSNSINLTVRTGSSYINQTGDSQPSELNFSSKEGQILTLNFTFPKKLSATESMNMNLNRNQKKIAEINFKGGQGNKYNGKRITFIWQGETQTATLSISGLIKNDSGVYQCNYVLNSKVEVSNSINLTVRTGSSYINQTGTSSPQLDTIKRQQESKPSQATPVYSIKYGVLEFPRRDALPPAMMPDHTDHVEYATITFPAGQEGGVGGKENAGPIGAENKCYWCSTPDNASMPTD
ncbi:UNVERIFIED_CONTAM: hypothetical protein FKN15_023242 [Acipenser sinensis]